MSKKVDISIIALLIVFAFIVHFQLVVHGMKYLK